VDQLLICVPRAAHSHDLSLSILVPPVNAYADESPPFEFGTVNYGWSHNNWSGSTLRPATQYDCQDSGPNLARELLR
jgi:hypothetical protein